MPDISVNFNFAGLVKAFVVFGLAVYVVFALVVVRQVALMVKTLIVGNEMIIRAIAYLHLLIALGVLVLSLAIL